VPSVAPQVLKPIKPLTAEKLTRLLIEAVLPLKLVKSTFKLVLEGVRPPPTLLSLENHPDNVPSNVDHPEQFKVEFVPVTTAS
jgi:hypothetical protein